MIKTSTPYLPISGTQIILILSKEEIIFTKSINLNCLAAVDSGWFLVDYAKPVNRSIKKKNKFQSIRIVKWQSNSLKIHTNGRISRIKINRLSYLINMVNCSANSLFCRSSIIFNKQKPKSIC